MLQGIEGVKNISDNIIVFGKSQADHDAALQAVFQKMRENNLTANPALASLINASSPKNVTEVSSFLGLAQYLARFIKDFASISAPIRQLTYQNAKWVWGSEQQHAFDCLKARMATPEVMKYFNSSLKKKLIVDASPVGLGAVFTQVTADGGTNIVAYASRSLTD